MVAEATWAKTLGEHIRTRRQAAGKSREDLAAAVGAGTAWIDLVEEGALPALPEPKRFRRLARALGSEPGELLEVAGYLPAGRGEQPPQGLRTLDLSADRVSRLQEVIASFSESLTPKQVADVVLQQAIDALQADGGSVVLATRNALELEIVSSSGFPPWIAERFGRYQVDESLPGAEAMRTGEPIWIDSMEEWRKRYPALAPVQEEIGYSAAAAIPLVVQDRRLGVLGLSFAHPIDFGESEHTFALTLARQCAQALDRAHLYAAEQAARAEAEIERARLHDLFMRAPARIAVARGPDHVYVFANERYVEYLDDPHILGKPAREVFPGAADQGIVAIADRVYTTGEPFVAIETPFRVDFDHDGTEEERYFNVVLQPTYEPDGSVDGVMLFTVDVTEAVRSRHRVEELLAERNAILGQIAEGLVIVDGTRHITFTNETAQ
ncbi:MAG TPA: GAF domain-containing protein, partial [Chloroflexota bacterium]